MMAGGGWQNDALCVICHPIDSYQGRLDSQYESSNQLNHRHEHSFRQPKPRYPSQVLHKKFRADIDKIHP